MFVVNEPMKTNEIFSFAVSYFHTKMIRSRLLFLTLGGYVNLQKRFFELLTTTVKIRLKRLFQRFNTVSNSD
jgi:hypothetical protein